MTPHGNHIPEALAAAFTHADAVRHGVSERRLRQLVAEGAVVRLGRGAYRRADLALVDEDLLEVALRAPRATVCLVTALSRHDLTDRIPDAIDVALPRGQRQPRVAAPVRWHRFAEATYDLGRESILVAEGRPIGIYNPERSIVDAFRLRHIEGEELAVEALRRWLRRPGATPSSLLAMARAFPKAESSLRDALRVLL